MNNFTKDELEQLAKYFMLLCKIDQRNKITKFAARKGLLNILNKRIKQLNLI